jgi:hypothetical protein
MGLRIHSAVNRPENADNARMNGVSGTASFRINDTIVWRRHFTVTIENSPNTVSNNIQVLWPWASSWEFLSAGTHQLPQGTLVFVAYNPAAGHTSFSVNGPAGWTNSNIWTVTANATFRATVVMQPRASGHVEVWQITRMYSWWSGDLISESESIINSFSFSNVALPHTFSYVGNMGSSAVINTNGSVSSFPVTGFGGSFKGIDVMITEFVLVTITNLG